MEQARESFARGIVLIWRADQSPEDRRFVDELRSIVQPYTGGLCPIVIDYQSDRAKAQIQLGDDWRVHPTDELLVRLRRLLSIDAVHVRYR